jgi:hypothetical protein
MTLRHLAAGLAVCASLLFGVGLAEAEPETATEQPPGPPPTRFTTRPSVMAGLIQWVAFGGANLAAQLKVGRLALEYSHGQALDYDRWGGFAKTSDERSAGISLFSPWTTGFGVGVQITPYLHALVEVKAHRYEVTGADAHETLRYTTFSIGPGVFYDLYLYKGLFVQPSVRFWPNVASTLDDHATVHRADGTPYQHESHALGFFANASLGWTFGGI